MPYKFVLFLTFLLFPAFANAEIGIPAFTVTDAPNGTQEYSLSIQILLMMTALAFLPAALIATTAFLRIVIVLALLRQALGTMQTPSNKVLISLAIFLTFFIMAPTFEKIKNEALQPYLAEEITMEEAYTSGVKPLHDFMIEQTRESDLSLFAELADVELTSPEETPLQVLIPAFMTSELKTAFQIGFMLFIPFLIIDLIVASLLMSMGMMMLSPMIISLPFKIMLFVLIDGWGLVMGTLANSFLAGGT
jgi:flagellar biosynthetic protein FliP